MIEPKSQQCECRAVLVGAGSEIEQAAAQLETLGEKAPSIVGTIDIDALRKADRVDHEAMRAWLTESVREGGCNTAIVSLPCAMAALIAELGAVASGLGIAPRVLPTLTDVMLGNTATTRGAGETLEIDLATLIGREPRDLDERLVRGVVTGRCVLITGAGGSIGSELAHLCARFEPSRLVLMDRSENALFEIDRKIAANHPALERRTILHDVVDAEATRQRVGEVTPYIVFHAAAHKHVPLMEDHPGAAVRNNLFGTKSIADASLEAGVERFVMISTDKAVNPTSVMGATKRMAELYVRSLNGRGPTRFCLVRFGNVLGSACSVLPIWAAQIGEGGPVTVTHAEMTRFFMTIPEAAALVVQAGAIEDEGARHGVFVLDMGEPVRIVELAERFVRLTGFAPSIGGRVESASEGRARMPIVFTGIRPGEKLYEELAHEAEELSETSVGGVLAWSGAAPSRERIARMIEELSSIATTQPASQVVQAIERHVGISTLSSPEQRVEIVGSGSRTRVGSCAA